MGMANANAKQTPVKPILSTDADEPKTAQPIGIGSIIYKENGEIVSKLVVKRDDGQIVEVDSEGKSAVPRWLTVGTVFQNYLRVSQVLGTYIMRRDWPGVIADVKDGSFARKAMTGTVT
jgi:hypothetical protein